MDIDRGIGVWLWHLKIFIERFARNVGKRRPERFAMASMAPGTKIYLPVPRESRGIKNATVRWTIRGFRTETLNVFASRPVTFFTGDANHKAGLAVTIRRGCERLKVSSVAFKATWNHRSIEIGNAVAISRAV